MLNNSVHSSDNVDRDLNASILQQLIDDIRGIFGLEEMTEVRARSMGTRSRCDYREVCQSFARAHRHLFYAVENPLREEGVEYLCGSLGLDIDAVRGRMREEGRKGMEIFKRVWPWFRTEKVQPTVLLNLFEHREIKRRTCAKRKRRDHAPREHSGGDQPGGATTSGGVHQKI